MPDQPYAAHPEVLVTDLNDELVLLHGVTGQMYSLNTVARSVWQWLPATRAALLPRLVEHYEVTPEQAGHDLDVLLADFRRLDMVKLS